MSNQAGRPVFGQFELKKMLDSAITGFLLRLASKRIDQFCQIDGCHFHQGEDKGGAEGPAGFMPRKMRLHDGVQLHNLIRHRPVLSEKEGGFWRATLI